MRIDKVVDILLRIPPAERDTVASELCAGDEHRIAHVRGILAEYDEPDVPWPPESLPCDVGPFRLEQEIGSGAHGVVYLARRMPLEGFVALKLMRPGPRMPEFIECVRREAGLARRIPSAHVVPVFDAGRIPRGPYYVEMAVCADPDPQSLGQIRLGSSLRDVRARLSTDEMLRHVEDLCRAVHAAHELGIVHGDIKPENVLVTPDSRRVMLADFGIASSLAATSDAAGRARIGTLEYMAPEQYVDRAPPSKGSDVYMLGGTLWFLLTSAAPHAGRTEVADAPKTPLPSTVPVRLGEIVERALAADPAKRTQSAVELADELRRFRTFEPTLADRRRPHRRVALFCRRHLREVVTAGLLLALLVPAGWAGYRWLHGDLTAARAERDRVEHDVDTLNRQKAAAEATIAALDARIAAAQGELEQFRAVVRVLGLVQQDLAKTHDSMSELTAKWARDAAEARSASEARAAAERAREEGRQARVDAAEALRIASEREGRLEASRASLSASQQRVGELEREVGAATQRGADAEREAHAAGDAARAAEARAREAEARAHGAELQVAALAAQRDEARALVEQLTRAEKARQAAPHAAPPATKKPAAAGAGGK